MLPKLLSRPLLPVLALFSALSTLAAPALSAGGALGPIPMSLKGVAPPPVPGLLDGSAPIVVDKAKAIALGKALFWDANVGSDGMACASCHFHAGADRRTKNQVAPAGQSGSPATGGFEAGRAVNYRLKKGDFPLTQSNVPLFETSENGFKRISDDAVGSAGTFSGEFRGVEMAEVVEDDCARSVDAVFHANGVGGRRVTQRNAPSVINAVFNHRNFWDGRANNVFNGSSSWGDRDPNAGVWVKKADGSVVKERLHLINSSLASQALGPIGNTTEMVCANRAFADLGRKLQYRMPLENQVVHWEDSVLGAYAFSTSGQPQNGLKTLYLKLIRQAFNEKYWSSNKRGAFGKPPATAKDPNPLPYNQLEANFGMFFGLAIQLYEATLISDDSPFDRSRRDAKGTPVDLSASQQRGMNQFRAAHCAMCHVGPLFTPAAIETNAQLAKTNPSAFGNGGFIVAATRNVVDRTLGLAGHGLVDTGFVATGVGKDEWDVGLGGNDPFGNPYSFAKQYMQYLAGNRAAVVDPGVTDVRPCDLSLPLARAIASPSFIFTASDGIRAQAQTTENCFDPTAAYLPTQSAALRELANPGSEKLLDSVNTAYKIPSLRNVELTGPYMHNGSMATLHEVVEFYARGGNFDIGSKQFALVFPQPDLQLDAGIREDLVNFLSALTDDRVRYERAPFDHPGLNVPVGHAGSAAVLQAGNRLDASLAVDEWEVVPAVGAAGRTSPLRAFAEYLAP